MAYRFKSDLARRDVTPKDLYLNRRQIMAAGAGLGAGLLAARAGFAEDLGPNVNPAYVAERDPNTLEQITSYNNFYEFGYDKADPAKNAHTLTVEPWSVEIGGLVETPGKMSLADILAGTTIEERVYRLRCVEGWSMVIPWDGFQLSALLDRVGVKPEAKFVAFETLLRPEEMPGQRAQLLDWPYVEGLRVDEAMHPLTFLATGLYGDELPKQNGAPIRLVVPWKYGFKSIKSVTKITLVDALPSTTWNVQNAREYGFYSNVNPDVDHPRWSQATERPIGGGLFAKRIPTRKFNGYDEVASLYEGMDLKQNF